MPQHTSPPTPEQLALVRTLSTKLRVPYRRPTSWIEAHQRITNLDKARSLRLRRKDKWPKRKVS